MLVEVKPLQWDESESDEQIMAAARTKIIHSGIKGEALLLGSRIVTEDAHGSRNWHHLLGRIMSIDPETDEATGWNPAFGFRCEVCGRRSFADDCFSWHCRVRGCYDGDGHLGEWNAEQYLRLASNEVQWNPR